MLLLAPPGIPAPGRGVSRWTALTRYPCPPEGVSVLERAGPGDEMLSLLARVVDAMSEAVLVIDQRGMVALANRSAAELFDLADTSAALHRLADYDRLIAEWRVGDEPFSPHELVSALSGQAISERRAILTTAAGTQRIVRFTATPIADDRGQTVLLMLLVSDVTLEERANTYWQAVGTGAEGLTAELDVDLVLRSVVEQITRALRGDVVLGIWLLEVPEQRLALRICQGVSDTTAERLAFIPLDCASFLCEAARTRRTQYTEDARRTPPEFEVDQRLVADEGLASWAGAPLRVRGDLIGVMGFGLRHPRRLYPQDLDAVETLSRLFAVALHHAELYETSQRQARLLLEEQQLQAELSQAITHDLRSPLATISGRAELLQDQLSAPEGLSLRELTTGLAKIRANVDRMAARVGELTDALRLRSGEAIELHRRATDLLVLAKTAADEHQQATQWHRIRVQSELASLVGWWDQARLGRVLDNLLSNAIKYSPDGTDVTLSLTREDDPESARAVLRVRDDGIGIAAADLPHIFERFYRGGNVEQVRGFGIGLAASRAIVEQHGGSLVVETAGPTGSTFVLRLPLQVPRTLRGNDQIS
jgi:signal transduction histidine kinase